MGRGLTGINPLKYRGVRPGTPPNMVIFTRRPTIKDYIEYEIGDLWVIPKRKPDEPLTVPSSEVWILVSKRYSQGIWKRFRFGGNTPSGSGYIITEYNTPGETGNHALDEQTQLVEIHAWGAGNSGGVRTETPTSPGDYISPGGGGGGYLHWLTPASTFGGGGTSVSYSVAADTQPSATVGADNIGDPTIFGGLKTPQSSAIKFVGDGSYPGFGSYIGPIGGGTIFLNCFYISMGNGMIDNGNIIDPMSIYMTSGFYDTDSPSNYILFYLNPYIAGHCGLNSFGSSNSLYFHEDNNGVITSYYNSTTGHPYLPGAGGNGLATVFTNGNNVGNTQGDIFAQGGAGSGTGDGADGADGGNGNGFYIAGAGGGGSATGVGGDGGWPGGGGGGGGFTAPNINHLGGKGAGGRLVVIEYLG